MFANLPESRNDAVLHIAAEVAETSDEYIPALLLKLQDVLCEHEPGSEAFMKIQRDIWEYDLTYVLCLALKRDFAQHQNGFHVASELVALAVTSCCGLDVIGRESFHKKLLPDLVDAILLLLCRLRDHMKGEQKITHQSEMISYARAMFTDTIKLIGCFPFLAPLIVESKHFLQILMSDNIQLFLTTASFLQELIKMDKMLLASPQNDVLYRIIDEFVFKISTSTDSGLASSSMRLLLLFIDVYPPLMALLLSKRYRGLKAFLGKWKGKGMDDAIRRLVGLLDMKTNYNEAVEKQHAAATTIQASYRALRTRRRLRWLTRCIIQVQRSYRRQKQIREEKRLLRVEQSQTVDRENEHRRKSKILSQSKQLKTIEGIPAKTVNKFLSDEQHRSAVVIQAAWRGYRLRHNLTPYLKDAIMVRAAMRIQRQVRKWLTRRRQQQHLLEVELMPAGLNDARREDLQQLIARIRDQYPRTKVSSTEAATLHDQAQSMLGDHFLNLRHNRRRDDQCKALIAQIKTSTDLLLEAPPLSAVTPAHVQLFASHHVLAKTAAINEHKEKLRSHTLPWWKHLHDDTATMAKQDADGHFSSDNDNVF